MVCGVCICVCMVSVWSLWGVCVYSMCVSVVCEMYVSLWCIYGTCVSVVSMGSL